MILSMFYKIFILFLGLGTVTIVLLQLLTFIEDAPVVPMNSALVVAKKYAMEALHLGLS